MDSAACEASFMARGRDAEESRCPMALLPPETKMQIISFLSTQKSLSRLGQSCRAWYEVANEELYRRDSGENNSFAIKWMAARAVDEQTTDSALRTLEISRRWGGQINAVNRRLCRARSKKDQRMYEMSTALHFAVFLGNMRLTKTLLDMNASLEISCSTFLWKSMGSEEVLDRVDYFRSVFGDDGDIRFGSAFPIFLAFIQRDADMCKLLVEHGAGREAIIVYFFGESQAMSILHFAAADMTTDYRQWQCLFEGFREFIDEPCPRDSRSTPLHIALINGCTQGMQIAVESGADKEARNSASQTPLFVGIRAVYAVPYGVDWDDPKPLEEHMRCLRKFADLGGSINPDGDSLLALAVQRYVSSPTIRTDMRLVIYFLLEHHVDINRTFERNANVINELIEGILTRGDDTTVLRLLTKLLRDLIDRGLNLTTPAPGLPSPLYCVLHHGGGEQRWLFDFLCKNGATIHEREVNSAFFFWCKTSRLWQTNKYDAWWQHQGQEDEMFQKWCEDPYNAWWWQHVKQISPRMVTVAYEEAVRKSRQLYDILTHLPLPVPSSGSLITTAFISSQSWSWKQVVRHEFEEDFLATYSSFNFGDNMVHLTVRMFIGVRDYSAADAKRDILYLMDKGVDVTSWNDDAETPLDILLEHGSSKDDFMELVVFLGGEILKVQELT